MKASRFNCYQIHFMAIGDEKFSTPVYAKYYPYQTALNTVGLMKERSKRFMGELIVVDVSDTPEFKKLIEQE